MLYNFDFDIAALFITTLLLVIAYARKKFPSFKLKAFRMFLILQEIAIISDIISCWTISYPERFSLWYDYLISAIYYLSHNICAIVFVLYGIYSSHLEKINRTKVINVLNIVGIVEVLLIATTPFTKLVFYYDQDMVYQRGPLVVLLYVFAIVAIIYVAALKIKEVHRMSLFEFSSYLFYFTIIAVSYVYTMLLDRDELIELFAISVGLIFLYIAQENPETFLYKKLSIFNMYAFEESTLYLQKKNGKYKVVVFMPRDSKNFSANFGHEQVFAIEKYIIQECLKNAKLKKKIYAFDELCLGLILNEDDDEKEYISIINKIFKDSVEIEGRYYTFNMSYCIASVPDVIHDFSELMEVIAPMMYRVMSHEGDRPLVVDRTWLVKESEKVVVRELKNAIKNKEIYVDYMPIFDTDTFRSFMAEANIKFKASTGEYIKLNDVVHLAEKHNLMQDIDELVLVEIGKFIDKSNVLELGIRYIIINIAISRLYDSSFADSILNIEKKYNIPKEKICFEIKELKSSETQPVVRENIRKIYEAGIHFVLSNFGEGRMDLDFIASVPLSAVNISSRLIKGVSDDSKTRGIVYDLCFMISHIGIRPGCEGVSTKEEEDFIKKTTCQFVQGSRYSKMLSGEEYIEFLRKQLTQILDDISVQG